MAADKSQLPPELVKAIEEEVRRIAQRELARVRRQVRKSQRELHDPDCPLYEEE